MRNLLFILLLWPMLLYGQVIQGGHAFASSTGTVPAPEPQTYSDNFDAYTLYTHLQDQTNWEWAMGEIEIADDGAAQGVCGDSAYASFAYHTGSVGDDQWAELELIEYNASFGLGPAVRVSGFGNGYAMFTLSGNAYLVRYNGGSQSILDTDVAGAWGEGDVAKISIEGYDIRCYINDVLITDFGTAGVYTDTDASKIASGNVGLMQRGGDNRGATGDNWQGGDL